jgi:hypothetical protein
VSTVTRVRVRIKWTEVGKRKFSLFYSTQAVSGVHQTSYSTAARDSFQAAKRPPRADIQNKWSLMLISTLLASSCCLIKYKNNFTFLPLE